MLGLALKFYNLCLIIADVLANRHRSVKAWFSRGTNHPGKT